MLIAEVEGKRCKATKGAKGICPYCKSEVIAKCGEQKIAHWAHKASKECDTWHDKETEWHLMWKNYFPESWQEIIKYDQITGEKHIADVCTEDGLILEFQHSAIKFEERQSREAFYKNMLWVVDGMRLKNDFSRFSRNITQNTKSFMEGFPLYSIDFLDEVLPKNWIQSNVPVLFDFKDGENELPLYCLLPQNINSKFDSSYIFPISRSDFISMIVTNKWITFYHQLIKGIISIEKEWDRINRYSCY